MFTRVKIGAIKTAANIRSKIEVASLAQSVGEVGLLQPVTVYPDGEGYVLLLGHRRLEAARRAGLDEIEVQVVDPPASEMDRIWMQLAENLEQAGLSPLDEGRAYQRLIELGMSQKEIARRRGVSEATICQRRKLLSLIPELQEAIAEGKLSAAAGEELARLEPEQQREVVAEVLRRPAVRRVKRLVDKVLKLRKLQRAAEKVPTRGSESELRPAYSTHSAVAELKKRLAEQCGLDPEEIMESRLAQYDLLLSQGIGITLHIGGGTLFRVHLPPELLGLNLEDQTEREFHEQHIDLGEFFLTSKAVIRELINIEKAARQYLRQSVLRRFGFEFEPGWVWVPVVAEGQGHGFHEVRARLEEYRAAYLATVEDLADRVPELKAETLAAVEEVAPTIYARLGSEESPPQEFVDNLKAWIEASFPTSDEIRQRGYFHIRYRVYPMPSQIAQDIAEAQAVHERQKLLLEHQRELLEQERKAKEALLDPMIHTIAQRLEALVGEAVSSVARALRKGGQLPAPTLQRVRNLVEELGPLNLLVGNADLEELTRRLDRLVQPGVKVDPGALTRALEELHQAAQAQSQALKPDMMLYLEL